MEFVIKVDLTEDKYAEFAKSTADEIIHTNEFKEAYKEAIKEAMLEPIKKDANSIIVNTLFGYHYYNKEDGLKIPKEIVTKAMEEYADEIKDAFKESMKESLKDYNFSDLYEKVLTAAVLDGMENGLKAHLKSIDCGIDMTISQVNNLRNRLGIQSY